MTSPTPGAVLLVGGDDEIAVLIMDGMALASGNPLLRAADAEQLSELLRTDAGSDASAVRIEALCVGPDAPEPMQLVQRAHREQRELAAVVVTAADSLDAVDRARLFTPFLGPDVSCRSLEEAALLGAELADAAIRTRERRTLAATMSALSDRAETPVAPRPLAGRHFARQLDRAPIGALTLDREGRIRGWNRRAQQLLDPQDRLIGTSLAELFPPNERTRLSAHLARAEDDDAGTATVEVFTLRSVTEPPPSVEVSSAVAEDEGSEEVIVLIADVTRRVAAEQRQRALEDELGASRRLLEAVVGGTADAVFVKDRAGRYLLINNAGAAALGRPPADVVGRTDAELLAGQAAERIREDDVTVIETQRAHAFEEHVTGSRVFLATKSPYYDHTGTVAGVVGTARDITDRKRDEGFSRFLNRAGEVLTSLDPEAAARGVADVVLPDVADFCVVSLAAPGGRAEAPVFSHVNSDALDALGAALDEHGRAGPVGLDGLSPGGNAALLRGGAPVPDRLDVSEPLEPAPSGRCERLLTAVGASSAMVLPLPGHGRALGTVVLGRTDGSPEYDAQDLRFASELARRVAVAIENARLHTDRTSVAQTLQRSLLPPSLAEIPGAAVAVRFHAAGRGVEVGGDFYDVFETSDGYALLIGDVCGKGPGAAAVTALARYTIRAVAMRESRPEVILARLNEALLRQKESGDFCTALLIHVTASPTGHRLLSASAGHPLPLVLRADGSGREVGVPGTMLGVVEDPHFETETIDLERGDACVLYTDGLNEAAAPRILSAENLLALLRPSAGEGAEAVARRLDVIPTSAGEDMRDDTAIVVFSVDAERPRNSSN